MVIHIAFKTYNLITIQYLNCLHKKVLYTRTENRASSFAYVSNYCKFLLHLHTFWEVSFDSMAHKHLESIKNCCVFCEH